MGEREWAGLRMPRAMGAVELLTLPRYAITYTESPIEGEEQTIQVGHDRVDSLVSFVVAMQDDG